MIPVNPTQLEPWMRRVHARVDAELEAFLAEVAVDPRQADLLGKALPESRLRQVSPGQLVVCVHVPVLVYAALTGEDGPAHALAVATTTLELGIDLLDHIQDRELGAHWAGVPPSLILLAATGFLGSLPLCALDAIDAPAEHRHALLSTLAARMRHVGLGQQLDLSLGGRADAAACLEVAELAAERRALYAGLAARLAGADARQTESIEAGWRAIGAARKLASDLSDLSQGPASRDLRAGVRTYPIAWAVAQDAALAPLLDAARADPEARAAVARRALAGGAVRRTSLEIARFRARARQAFAAAGLEPSRAWLMTHWLEVT